jgi:cytochrome P450
MTIAAHAKPVPATPPSPPAFLLFGHLPGLKDVLGYYTRCKNEYGNFVKFSMAGWETYLISDPEVIETVLVTNHRNFVKHRFFWRHVTAIFGDGLLTSTGAKWVQQRKLIQPAFHRDRIDGYGAVMVERTETMLEGWRDGETRDVHTDMMRVTMDIVVRTLFGGAVSEEDAAAVHDAFNVAIEQIALRFRRPFRIADWIPVPGNVKFNRSVRELDRLIYGFIRERRGSSERGNDLLSMLVDARDESGQTMSDQQLRDEMITLFLAGHETTALVLSWTWYLLSQNPEAEATLHEELDRVLAGRAPAYEDVPKLEYANHVILESMRLYPPAYGFGREAVEDCELGGYRVPARSTIHMFPWLLHRDPRWFPEPLRFHPGRWAGDFAKTLPPFVYMPFGGGPRRCIGNTFAMMEAVLLLATVARRFKLTLAPGHIVEPAPSITLRPKYGMKMTVSSRA